jgi:general secretion pathway protein J
MTAAMPSIPSIRPAANGFTLVELLIALLLFALLSAAATALLSFGIDARARSGQRLDELAALTRARAMLTADLAQAAPRLWRDDTGTSQLAFASDGSGGPSLLRFIRRGWRNDGGAARSSLQRVEYRRNGDRLERISWPRVDGSAPNPPALMVAGVSDVKLRYYYGGGWRDAWVPTRRDSLPGAIELTITANGLPTLRQAFLVGPDIAP